MSSAHQEEQLNIIHLLVGQLGSYRCTPKKASVQCWLLTGGWPAPLQGLQGRRGDFLLKQKLRQREPVQYAAAVNRAMVAVRSEEKSGPGSA